MSDRKINPLSEAIRLLRVYSDISQGDLAERLGIRNTVLSEMEHGRRPITVKTLQQYSDLFNIKISTIQAFAEEIKRNKNLKKEIFNQIMKMVMG
jgi:transcriptional regulator with XRE-family HTH domain